MMKKTVVGLGEVLWDMLPDGRQIGGAPANFAFHAGQWGHRAYVVSAVGTDKRGAIQLPEDVINAGLEANPR